MENELQVQDPMALGDVFVQSGMFPDIKSKAQACVKILAGRELGITPIEAMTNIYIVNNKLALTSKLMASLLKKKKKYDYLVEKLDEKECIVCFYQISDVHGSTEVLDGKSPQVLLGKSVFTFADAAKAGLVNKDNWKNYPRNMLFARALSNGIRWFCPDAVLGYSVEEMEDVSLTATPSIVEITAEGEVKNG